MKGFSPGFMDKLFWPVPSASSMSVAYPRFSIEQLKEAVAKDLEHLLNTRRVFSGEWMEAYPEVKRSLLTYGLHDVASASLASADDCAFICQALQEAISIHEPRLTQVRASLASNARQVNRLNFSIQALLEVEAMAEPVNFDAVLNTASLQYAIQKAK